MINLLRAAPGPVSSPGPGQRRRAQGRVAQEFPGPDPTPRSIPIKNILVIFDIFIDLSHIRGGPLEMTDGFVTTPDCCRVIGFGHCIIE